MERTVEISNNMDESQNHVEWKKASREKRANTLEFHLNTILKNEK